jgi:Protein of unknown function (DUF3108)
MKLKVLPLILSICLFCGFAISQPKSEPFAIGEKLTYEGKLSKSVLRGISVADLTFTVAKDTNDNNYSIKADAVSKGTLLKLFRFSFVQNIESIVDGEFFRATKTIKHDVQGDRVRVSESVFDYKDKKVTYIETDLKDAMKAPRKIATALENDETHDIITAIYHVRRLPLAVGKAFELSVSDSGLVYKIPVRVTAREQQNSILGKIWCFRVEPQIFGIGRFIEQKGSMIIWISDNAKRLPIRSTINANIGKLEVKLKKIG